MSNLGDLFRRLHRIHRQRSDLAERRQRGPQQIKLRDANVARLEAALGQAQNDVKAARVTSDQKQLALKSGEDKIKGLQLKLNQAVSNREYQALKDQIAADQMANSVLADEILELLDKIEELKKGVVDSEQALAKGRAERDKLLDEVRQQQGQLDSEVSRLETELVEAENLLPPDVRPEYDRVTKQRGAEAMAVVEGDACGGCFQRITANMHSELRLSKPVFCKSCGSLLYLPEDRSPGKG